MAITVADRNIAVAAQPALNDFLKKNVDQLAYLRARWQDEREYEDFNEYVEVMKKMVPEGWRFIKATKQPFGFVVNVGGNVKAAFTCTARGATYKFSL